MVKEDIAEGDPLSVDMFETKQIHPSGRPETAINVDEVDFNGMVSTQNIKGRYFKKRAYV